MIVFRHTARPCIRLLAQLLVSLSASACMPSPSLAPTPAADGAASDSGRAGGPHATIKPYDEVIPRTARTSVGLFKTHRVGDTLYFEIPRSELNKDMLLVGRYARAAAIDAANPFGAYGGDEFGERTLRWERSGNRIILRSPSFAIMADTSLPIYRAVRSGSYAPIIAIFDIAAGFQAAATDVLADRAGNAMEMMRARWPQAELLIVAGGVAANRAIRAALETAAARRGFRLVAPPLRLCTDNAVMVAWTGIERLRLGWTNKLDFPPRPRWPLDAPDLRPPDGA